MQPGDVVAGRFDVEVLAGAGGMGQVHRAHDRHTGERVALKVLASDVASHAARFAHEARALAELSHPCIVRYVAHGQTETGEPYLAMEWLDGEDLSRRLERGRFSLEDALGLASRVAEALAAAHAKGIVHRDLKPSNVFLLDRGVDQIKVLDFGIARLADTTHLTKTGMLVGTPGYMAPEQAQNGRAVDGRADVFALGCLLFECLTGARAFAGEQLLAVLAKVLFTDPPCLRELRAEAPVALEQLVARMLAKDPKQRPRDGAAVAEELAALAHEVAEAAGAEAGHPNVALTRSERRTVSVVLIHGETAVGGSDDTLGEADADASEVLRRGAETFGGRLEQLRDGSVVVSIAGAGPPTDQAAQAARCALWLRDHASPRALALATGRGEVTGRRTAAEAIDRAAALLARALPSARVADRASPIPIDETTARLLDGRFDVREDEAGSMLHGERELAEGTRSLLNKPTACVGRERELSTLVQMFGACVEDFQAHVALVTGPAGIGKSRLVHELLARLRRRDEPFSVWIGRGDALRAGSALSLLAQAVRSACEIRGDEPLTERRDKLSARVARHVEASKRRRVVELLGELVGAPFPDEDSELLRAARMNTQIMNGELRRAWLDFLQAEQEAGPILLVLEDLHWGDSPSVQFIDASLRELDEGRWMVLALARPEVYEVFPRLWAERRMQTIALGQLSRTASERLVRQVLGDEIGPETLARLVAQADGNAFYLEELIRATAERPAGQLPETVVAMVQSRLAALDGEDRRALRAAAVFGEVFWPVGVAVLLGGEERASPVERRLLGLVEREVLVRRSDSRFLGQVELAFRHVLLREGAYEMLTDEDRVLGHRLAGEWLEGAGERDPKLLAEHFDRGGEGARAATHYLRAAEQALDASDHVVALELSTRGMALTSEPQWLADLRAIEAEARLYRGDIHGTLRAAEAVLHVARGGSRTEGRALFSGVLAARYMFNDGLLAVWVNRLLHTEPEPDAIPLLASAFFSIIVSFLWKAKRVVAESYLRRLEEVTAGIMEHDPITAETVEITRAIWVCHVERDFWGMGEHLQRAAAHRERLGGGGTHPFGRLHAALSQLLIGLFDRAEQEFAAMSERASGHALAYARVYRAIALLEQRKLDESRALLSAAIDQMEMREHAHLHLEARLYLIEADIHDGCIDAADSKALALGEIEATEPYFGMWFDTMRACIRLAQGQAKEASMIANRAYAQSRACGMGYCNRHAKLLLVRAEAFYALGDHNAAHEAIREAEQDLLRRATKITDPYVRRCFLEDIPDHHRTLEVSRQWLAH